MGSSTDHEKEHSGEPSPSSSPSLAPATRRRRANDGIEDMLTPQLSREVSHVLARRTTSARTSDPNFEVDWDSDDDPENPLNWSTWYKGLVIIALSWSTLV